MHRIGRTGRAGASGIAISFCDHEERAYLKQIERLIRKTLTVDEGHPENALASGPAPPGESGGKPARKPQGRRWQPAKAAQTSRGPSPSKPAFGRRPKKRSCAG